MYKYLYIPIAGKQGFAKVTFEEHREIINKYAQQGYRYVGYIPRQERGYGILTEIDLIFEKEED